MPGSLRKSDFASSGAIAGALLFIVGGVAAYVALEFDNESRYFPLVVASFLAVTGGAIAAHAIAARKSAGIVARKFGEVGLAVLIVALWAALFAGGGGFVLPTFAMQAGLLYVAGVRRPVYLASMAALVTAFAWLLFVLLLDIPLPPSLLPAVFQGF